MNPSSRRSELIYAFHHCVYIFALHSEMSGPQYMHLKDAIFCGPLLIIYSVIRSDRLKFGFSPTIHAFKGRNFLWALVDDIFGYPLGSPCVRIQPTIHAFQGCNILWALVDYIFGYPL